MKTIFFLYTMHIHYTLHFITCHIYYSCEINSIAGFSPRCYNLRLRNTVPPALSQSSHNLAGTMSTDKRTYTDASTVRGNNVNPFSNSDHRSIDFHPVSETDAVAWHITKPASSFHLQACNFYATTRH